MGRAVIKVMRTIRQTKEIEVELPGDDESMIEENAEEYVQKHQDKFSDVEDLSWDLEDIDVIFEEVVEFPEFDEEE